MQFVVPEPRDILCGRGITCHQHQGNKLLRQLIDRNLPKYTVADSKSDKSSILREIIRNILQQGGRFLKKDSESDRYYEAGMKAARDKVGHCLREAMAERTSRIKPSYNRIVPNLVPKPLLCRQPTNDKFYPLSTSSQHIGISSHMFDCLPSIVSESDQHDTSSQDGDDDMSNVSADSFAISSNCVSSTSISNSKSEAATDIVDALYELPTQGEWEQLILPKAYFVRSGNVDLILAVPASTWVGDKFLCIAIDKLHSRQRHRVASIQFTRLTTHF